MAVPESQTMQWLVERNEAGAWALTVRVAGQRRQLTAWLENKDDVLLALADVFRSVQQAVDPRLDQRLPTMAKPPEQPPAPEDV